MKFIHEYLFPMYLLFLFIFALSFFLAKVNTVLSASGDFLFLFAISSLLKDLLFNITV